jgi:hypothetical protein
MRDVANLAGVSVSTVARVISGSPMVRQESRDGDLFCIITTHGNPEQEMQALHQMREHRARAVLLVVATRTDEDFTRRIVFLGAAANHSTAEDRLTGYLEAFHDAGWSPTRRSSCRPPSTRRNPGQPWKSSSGRASRSRPWPQNGMNSPSGHYGCSDGTACASTGRLTGRVRRHVLLRRPHANSDHGARPLSRTRPPRRQTLGRIGTECLENHPSGRSGDPESTGLAPQVADGSPGHH